MFDKDIGLAAIAWFLYFLSAAFLPNTWAPQILLVASLGISLATWIGRIRTRRASEFWPAVPGSVEAFRVQDNPGRSVVIWPHILHVAYSYVAEGERYSGFHEQKFRREADADLLAAALKASGVQVRYNPKRPDRSAVCIQQAP